MRTKHAIKNMYIGIIGQGIMTLLGLLSRKVFIDNLGSEYLGVNGLLTNVLSMLSLVEGGIGVSIVYNLYKPLAEKDEEKIIALVQLYKKLYKYLAILVFILSMSLYSFLGFLMKDSTEIKSLFIIYLIFVVKNVISYLNAHKWSLINADQKGYVLTKYYIVFNVTTTISKIIILKMTESYVFFLLIEALIFIIQNIWNGHIVNKSYPYIKTKQKYIVEKQVKENLITNVKAMFLHNVGGYCVFGTDNILISTCVSIKTVGLYSNYTMIINQLVGLLGPIIGAIGAGVGNLIATETKEKSYEIFNVIYFINFCIYSFCVIFLFNLLEPFINLWLGEGLLLDKLTFIVVLFNFYLSGLRGAVSTFKSKAGIFSADKYIPLIESVVNLVSSLILVKYLGLSGIFLGTTISTLVFPFWIQPKLVYSKVFNKSVLEYFKRYIVYLIIMLGTGTVTTRICNVINLNGFIALVIKGIICILVISIIYIAIFYNTTEFKYLYKLFINIVNNIRKNVTNRKKVQVL